MNEPIDPTSLQRILAVRLDNIGDVVLVSPALRALRAWAPRAELTLLASPAGAAVAPMLPALDRTEVLRASWQQLHEPADPRAERQLVARLRRARYDAAFIFTSWSQSPWPPAYACLLAGIPVRVGESKEFGGTVLTHNAPSLPDEVHQAERNLHLVEHAGVPVADRHLALTIPVAARDRADALLDAHRIGPGDTYAVVAPGASCPSRRYPLDRFAAVVHLLHEAGLRTVAVGSERERAVVAPVAAAATVDLVGATSLPELAAVIAGAAVAVVNDSGPMHLADAAGVPQVVLYGGTEEPTQYGPRRSPHRLLRRPTPCTPCHRFDCPIGLPCLDVAPDEVAAHAIALLATPGVLA